MCGRWWTCGDLKTMRTVIAGFGAKPRWRCASLVRRCSAFVAALLQDMYTDVLTECNAVEQHYNIGDASGEPVSCPCPVGLVFLRSQRGSRYFLQAISAIT